MIARLANIVQLATIVWVMRIAPTGGWAGLRGLLELCRWPRWYGIMWQGSRR